MAEQQSTRDGFEPNLDDSHVAQFYGADERALVANVTRYIAEGLADGDNILVVATPDHRRAFLEALDWAGARPELAFQANRLSFQDAYQLLGRFLPGGCPDSTLFDESVGALVRAELGRTRKQLRVFGEMVGILWRTGQFSSACRLEQLWNRLRRRSPFRLFCGYPIDVFAAEFSPASVDPLLRAHTHLLPAGKSDGLEDALKNAFRDVLRKKHHEMWSDALAAAKQPSWGSVPMPEAIILWLNSRHPEISTRVLRRAREYYNTSF
jgi:MEDS: MEthanogen/methylotroph, DcmR Sensory domain